MIVVSNTSPLNYLILLKREFVLPALFQTVVAPPAVIAELSRPRSPELVRTWATAPPEWLQVQAPSRIDPSLDLDTGELEAIALAEELKADRILLDEAKGRQVAVARGLRVAGTLAILFEASERGLLSFDQAIDELRRTTFYLDETLIQTIRDRQPRRRG